MAYNKAKAEREWLLWKEAEEKKLRTLGVDEGTIQYLRQYDWQMFKSDRKYYEWMSNPEWSLVGIFADEGISGTQADKRKDFMRMIRMCRKGKIDQIITKSVSRFARSIMITCISFNLNLFLLCIIQKPRPCL